MKKCSAVSQRLALTAIRDVIDELRNREYRVVGCALLTASNRPLPSLPQILASHALIHTAEGEFFRNIMRKACEQVEVKVTGFPEREVEDHAMVVLGSAALQVQRRISAMGKVIGPPWTKDQKTAALAAAIVLSATTRPTPAK